MNIWTNEYKCKSVVWWRIWGWPADRSFCWFCWWRVWSKHAVLILNFLPSLHKPSGPERWDVLMQIWDKKSKKDNKFIADPNNFHANSSQVSRFVERFHRMQLQVVSLRVQVVFNHNLLLQLLIGRIQPYRTQAINVLSMLAYLTQHLLFPLRVE